MLTRPDRPSAGLGTRLRQLLAVVDGDVQAVYDEIGVPFRPRFFPVAAALLAGPAGVNDIARAAGVSQPAATQTIGEMRRLGLVRSTAGADRRSRQIELTAEGRQVAQRLQPVWAAIAAAAAELETELSAGLAALLDEAIAAVNRKGFRARIRGALSQGGD